MKIFNISVSNPQPNGVLIKFKSKKGKEKERQHRIVLTDLSLLDLIENDRAKFDEIAMPMIHFELRKRYDSDKKM